MRDPRRIDDVLEALGRYWRARPDLRLCQIIGNFANDTARAADDQLEVSSRVYNIEDELLVGYFDERNLRGVP